jgi:phosphate transport system protein
MGEHTVTSYDEELGDIDRLIREMGTLSTAMVDSAMRALLAADVARAQGVIADDALMDAKQRELDGRAITLIARRQPMAQDLRAVVGAIRMAGDLERIGDLAKNIAKRVGAVGQTAAPRGLSHGIEAMSAPVLEQVRGAISLFAAHDAAGLERLRAEDQKVDVGYTSVFRELLTYMMEDPRNITPCTHLLFCAKNLERIGDHVTNIAENGYYVLTGAQLLTSRPKLDETSMTGGLSGEGRR